MQLYLNTKSLESYRQFLAGKRLPLYSITGHCAWFPDEYASLVVGSAPPQEQPKESLPRSGFLFDYQRDIADLAIAKRKFAIFADCGLGKTLIYFEFAREFLHQHPDRGVLILSPLMVCEQTQAEFTRWYGHEHDIQYVPGSKLQAWLDSCAGQIAITNYDVFKHDYGRGQLGCLILDESSILKSHYGKYGEKILLLGRGLDWKLCGTGTPAPNDRIEYANHAVFLDQYPTVNSFLARYFVNRGQTGERWELKNHALERSIATCRTGRSSLRIQRPMVGAITARRFRPFTCISTTWT